MGRSDWKRIASRGNPMIVQTAKLSSRKFREETSTFFFEGVHLLEEYLRFGWTPKCVFVLEEKEEQFEELLKDLPQDAVISVPEHVFRKICTEQAPQGVLTVSPFLPCVRSVNKASEVPGRLLLLESVRDNGNVGTVIRTASALGWTCVLSSDCADIYSPKTVRASMGTVFSGAAAVCGDLVSLTEDLKSNGRTVMAAALCDGGETLGAVPVGPDDCFLVGNEGQGISPELISAAGRTVRIPMTGNAESLNAAVAAAVLMWEGARTDPALVPNNH
ncbi:MAG: RNA methyltransferase [Clostridia bacterium]|nr:RNA methyltransferase [Clostridia bacterium]